VRKPFAASFSCERVNSRADCLPIRPLRLEFSSPVPRKFAERIVLAAPDGTRKPRLEQGRGEVDEQLISFGEGALRKFLYLFRRNPGELKADPSESGVSAVQFDAPLPENAALRIELPKDLRDDAGRTLSNAESFPLQTKTAAAPAVVKFPAATFGVLELNAEPHLPVTVRQVEGDLSTRAVSLAPGAVRDLRVADDAAIIEWLAKLKRYDESRLPRSEVESELGIKLPAPPPRPAKPARQSKRYGEAVLNDDEEYEEARDLVQTRSVGLLNKDSAARRLSLPPSAGAAVRPFEVIGIPMPQPGFHVVEIESPKLGAALLDRQAPMYVRTSVLVTNLGVHFKWGAVNSAVWVTTLDKARPVANAQVQISDCRAKRVWTGKTDEQGLARVPVRVSAQLRDASVGALIGAERFPGFRFEPPREPRDPNARSIFSEDYVDEDDESRAVGARDGGAQLVANKLALTLDKNGAGKLTLPQLPALRQPRELLVQATYADPNGEIQTLSQTLPVWPSGLVLGVRTDAWVSVRQKVATQVLVLDTAGKPAAKVKVDVRAVAHRTSSVRRRLVGGFYAYDNQNANEDRQRVQRQQRCARAGAVRCRAEVARRGRADRAGQGCAGPLRAGGGVDLGHAPGRGLVRRRQPGPHGRDPRAARLRAGPDGEAAGAQPVPPRHRAGRNRAQRDHRDARGRLARARSDHRAAGEGRVGPQRLHLGAGGARPGARGAVNLGLHLGLALAGRVVARLPRRGTGLPGADRDGRPVQAGVQAGHRRDRGRPREPPAEGRGDPRQGELSDPRHEPGARQGEPA
jgi:hypothetical protein